MPRKSIIFFSLHYPFHISDSYLDKEFELLSREFDKSIIISANTFSEERRPTPANATVYRFTPNEKKLSLAHSFRLVFAAFFYQELYRLLFTYKVKFSIGLIKELFAFHSRALHTVAFLKEIIKKHEIDTDHLLIYSYWMIESSFAAALLKKEIPSIKIISRAHSLDVYFDRSPVGYLPFRKFILTQLNRLYFISENAKNYFIKNHFLSEEDTGKISISRIGIIAKTKFWGKTPEATLRIVSVAYIQKLKRVDLIVDVLSLIQNIKIEWIHAGHSNHNVQDFEQIQEYAKSKLASNPNISYQFLGKTSKEDLFNLYEDKVFDFFLSVSETEGIPVSMMEAMSYSVPVIGTNVGGVSEIVENNVNGFLLSPYPNATEVKAAVLRFNGLNTEEKNELRKNAFTTWSEKYNSEKNDRKFAEEVVALMK